MKKPMSEKFHLETLRLKRCDVKGCHQVARVAVCDDECNIARANLCFNHGQVVMKELNRMGADDRASDNPATTAWVRLPRLVLRFDGSLKKGL
jgi:hypothetical protein